MPRLHALSRPLPARSSRSPCSHPLSGSRCPSVSSLRSFAVGSHEATHLSQLLSACRSPFIAHPLFLSSTPPLQLRAARLGSLLSSNPSVVSGLIRHSTFPPLLLSPALLYCLPPLPLCMSFTRSAIAHSAAARVALRCLRSVCCPSSRRLHWLSSCPFLPITPLSLYDINHSTANDTPHDHSPNQRMPSGRSLSSPLPSGLLLSPLSFSLLPRLLPLPCCLPCFPAWRSIHTAPK